MNPFEPPARVLIYASLMLLIGLPVGMAMVVLPTFVQQRADPQPILARAKRALVFAAILLIVGAATLFVAQVIPLELEFTTIDEWSQFAHDSLLGQMTLVRVALGVIALIALVALRRRGEWMAACVVVALLAQATITRTSHSAAMSNSGGRLPVAADFAHLLGGALWGGGLVALWLALLTPLPLGERLGEGVDSRAQLAGNFIRRFSPLGMLSVALVGGTGLLLASAHIPNSNALTSTQYGQLLLLKTAGVVVAVALAGLHKFVSQRRMQTANDVRMFMRTLRVEACVVFAVFACAAALTSAMPPHKSAMQAMADGSTMTMTTTDPNFERLLTIAATATIVAGVVALALEWRARPKTQS